MLERVCAPGRHEGLDGWWLRNAVAEAFVCARPAPRVVSFRILGRPSLLQDDWKRTFHGVRSCFMEPTFVPESAGPNQQPAEGAWIRPNILRLTAGVDEVSRLRLTMEIAIDNHTPRLSIRHGLTNSRENIRTIAPWALTVFPCQGVGVAPWRTGTYPVRSYLLFFETDPREPCLRPAKRALGVDFGSPPRNAQIKVGTNSNSGWVAYAYGDNALVSSVPFIPGAVYPENDTTVTFYATDGTVDFTDESFCEIEHVGPLASLEPGATVWLNQTLEIVSGIEASEESPDALMDAILTARRCRRENGSQ